MDKSSFFASTTENPELVQQAADTVNAKHNGETAKRGRGRPKGSTNAPKQDTVASPVVGGEKPAPYIDPEVVRVGIKAIVRAVDQHIGTKFYNIVKHATNGDKAMAEAFRAEAAVSNELVEGYGEAGVSLVKKYAFLLEYAPEAMLLSCLLADCTLKWTTYQKIKELCAFVSTLNRKEHEPTNNPLQGQV